MHIYALRLQPNTDLRIELERLCKGFSAELDMSRLANERFLHMYV